MHEEVYAALLLLHALAGLDSVSLQTANLRFRVQAMGETNAVKLRRGTLR